MIPSSYLSLNTSTKHVSSHPRLLFLSSLPPDHTTHIRTKLGFKPAGLTIYRIRIGMVCGEKIWSLFLKATTEAE